MTSRSWRNPETTQADLYQVLAYCTALGLDRGHLIYARGNELPARYRVLNTHVEIICHALDLDVEPDRLLSQVERLANVLARSGGHGRIGTADVSLGAPSGRSGAISLMARELVQG